MNRFIRYFVSSTLTATALRRPFHYETLCQSDRKEDLYESGLKKNLIIVKYGGSAITIKSSFETLNDAKLLITANQMNEIVNSQSAPQFVIVHGAGSFGHFQASEYLLSKGGSDITWKYGMAVTRQSVLKLNSYVMDAHIRLKLPVVSVSLFPTCVSDTNSNNFLKLVQDGSLHSIKTILSQGLIPIIHGDVIFDNSQRCSIFSGDKILLWICKNFLNDSNELKPSRAVFLTDVPGVFDKNPTKYTDAKLIKLLTVKNDGTISIPCKMDTSAVDVTGGIRAKIQAAADMAILGIPVYIVQVGTEHAMIAMSGGEPAICTKIIKDI